MMAEVLILVQFPCEKLRARLDIVSAVELFFRLFEYVDR